MRNGITIRIVLIDGCHFSLAMLPSLARRLNPLMNVDTINGFNTISVTMSGCFQTSTHRNYMCPIPKILLVN